MDGGMDACMNEASQPRIFSVQGTFILDIDVAGKSK